MSDIQVPAESLFVLGLGVLLSLAVLFFARRWVLALTMGKPEKIRRILRVGFLACSIGLMGMSLLLEQKSLMGSRQKQLKQAAEGYARSGVLLVAYDGQYWTPGGLTDDTGIYLFIPWIAYTFRIPVSTAAPLFFHGILAFSVLMGALGFGFLFRSRESRWIAGLGLLLQLTVPLLMFRDGEVYVIPLCVSVAALPWILVLFSSRAPLWVLTTSLFVGGVGFGLAHGIRSHAATPALLFLGALLLFHPIYRWREKAISGAAVIVGLVLSGVFYQNAVDKRDAFLAENAHPYPVTRVVVPEGERVSEQSLLPTYEPIRHSHPFWHQVYIGLGFLRNPFGITYLDESAMAKVGSISPGTIYLSEAYENILKSEIVRIFQENPLFVLQAFIVKASIALLFLFAFANFGLLVARLSPKGWLIESAFWLGMGWSALPVVLTAPRPAYLVGLLSFATLYAVVSMKATDFKSSAEEANRKFHRAEQAG